MAQPTHPPATNGPWVLLAEDDQDLSDLICESLRANGYQVLSCTKADEAIKALSTQNFSCLILDWHLATGTADQVVWVARRNLKSLNRETPIIVMSGNFEPSQLQQVRPYVSGAIVKPFQVQSLKDRVKQLCTRVIEPAA
jgi:DNA-binding response OmpR family regulator